MLWLQVSTAVFVVTASLVAFYNFRKVFQIIAAGAKANVFNEFSKRISITIVQVFMHKKLLRQVIPGVIHFIIFWGFVFLSLGTVEWIFHGVTGGGSFKFLGRGLYGLFLFSQDLFNVLVLIVVLMAVYRRAFMNPKRMADNTLKSKADAYFILVMIAGLVITSLITHAIEIHNQALKGVDYFTSFQPAASLLANTLLTSSDSYSLGAYYFWWSFHLFIVFGFLNFLPFSKHLHVVAAMPNVFFSKTEPRGRLSTPDLEDESIEEFGAEKVEDLKWTTILDSYACTECGRCNEFCPTATTGKDLRPKTLMIDLRAAAAKRAPLYQQVTDGNAALSQELSELKEECLVPNTFSDQFVWDCTTCGACVEACPVMIDHVDSLVEMRRALVLNRASNPDEATTVFRNWESSSNPWGLSESSRQEWLVDKGVPIFTGEGDFEYLYYIGCAGSYDDRNKKVVESVIKILTEAKVKFGILGKEERCNGETARRMGNEWLAQQMMQTNLELLKGKGAKKIITSCPHCFNTLANEYPALGADFETLHHTQVIDDLMKSGRLKVKTTQEGVTFHDSCYIGRYNKIYDQPRDILSAVSKDKPLELKRNREQGFCCGAGGGRMWLEETTGTRINENRAQEVIDVKAKKLGVSCPFCMTMLSDGLKSKGREDIIVQDIAEIVAESLDAQAEAKI